MPALLYAVPDDGDPTNEPADHALPWDVEAERAVLGATMVCRLNPGQHIEQPRGDNLAVQSVRGERRRGVERIDDDVGTESFTNRLAG